MKYVTEEQLDKAEPELVERWKCCFCSKEFVYIEQAQECLKDHIKERDIRKDFFENNFTLGQLHDKYNIFYKITEEQKSIAKDNCFIIHHWSLCKEPAYKITKINCYGRLTLGGVGGYLGYYQGRMGIIYLPKPHPPEKHYIYKNLYNKY